MVRHILIFLVFLAIVGCGQNTHEWNPIFEDTHFEYLNDHIRRSLSLLNTACVDVDEATATCNRDSLDKVRSQLLDIQDYYLPLTDIRQKLYDAERYVKLGDSKRAEKLLRNCKTIIAPFDLKTRSKVFDQVMLKLDRKVDEAVASLDENNKANTYEKMKALGEHINLMLYKGDLVLSGIEFDN